MGFIAAKCTQCGANVQVDESKDSGICSHCNTAFVTEKAINNYNSFVTNNHNYSGATIVGDNELKKLLDAAKGFEKLGDIESACKTYKKITQEYPQEFDGWWGLISCKLSLSVEKNKSLSLWEMATTFNFEEIASEYEKNLNNYILAARKLATPDQLKMIDDKMIEYKNDIDQILLKKFEEASIKIRNSYKSIDDLYDEMIKTSVGYVGRNEKKVREYFFEIRPDKKKRVVYLSKINEAHNEYSTYNHKDSIENRTEVLGLSNNNELLLNDKVSQYKIEYSRNKGKKGNLYNAFAMYKGSIHLSKSYISETFQIVDKAEEELILWVDNDLVKFRTLILSSVPMSRMDMKGSCYVATCVYGTYDCPQLWTLRRYRDSILASSWHGRLFIKVYYTFSPQVIKLFGNSNWFNRLMKEKLDRMVNDLHNQGIENTPYEDRSW